MMRRLTAVVAAVLFLGMGVGQAPPTALAAGTVTLTVNGSSALSTTVGTSLTAAATISGFTPTLCLWRIKVVPTQITSPVSGYDYGSTIGTNVPASAGACASLVAVLPNLVELVSIQAGGSSTAQLTLFAVDGSGATYQSNTVTVTFASSSAHPTPSSSVPLALWRLSNSKPVAGELVTMNFYPVGFPADWLSNPGDSSWSWAHTNRTAGSTTIPNPWSPFTFTQPSPASTSEVIYLGAKRVDTSFALQFYISNDVIVVDPPAGTPVAVLMDESASMGAFDATKKARAIDAYNRQVSRLVEGKVGSVDIAFFKKSGIRHLVTRAAAADVPKLTKLTYQPASASALYDRLASLIQAESAAHPGQALTVVIVTNGRDTASTKWSRRSLLALISKKRTRDGWTFIYPLRTL